jgi:hypothetical protein
MSVVSLVVLVALVALVALKSEPGLVEPVLVKSSCSVSFE